MKLCNKNYAHHVTKQADECKRPATNLSLRSETSTFNNVFQINSPSNRSLSPIDFSLQSISLFLRSLSPLDLSRANSLFATLMFPFLTARRYASAVLAVVACPSVCLSVCLSQAGIVSKRQHIESRKQRRTVAQGI